MRSYGLPLLLVVGVTDRVTDEVTDKINEIRQKRKMPKQVKNKGG